MEEKQATSLIGEGLQYLGGLAAGQAQAVGVEEKHRQVHEGFWKLPYCDNSWWVLHDWNLLHDLSPSFFLQYRQVQLQSLYGRT